MRKDGRLFLVLDKQLAAFHHGPHEDADAQGHAGRVVGQRGGDDAGDAPLVGGGAHAHTDIAAGEGLNAHGDAEEDGKGGTDQRDQRQDEHRDDGGGAEGTNAVPVAVHGLVASLIALGDGQQAGRPQGAAHRHPGRKDRHDAVTQEAHQIGPARVEDDGLVRTGGGGLGDHFLGQHEVGEGDDVGGQRAGQGGQEEGRRRQAQAEDGEVLQHEAHAQRGQAPLDLGHRDLPDEEGSQHNGKQLGGHHALVAQEVQGLVLLGGAGEGGVKLEEEDTPLIQQEEVGQQHRDGHGNGRLGHTCAEHVDAGGDAGAQHNSGLDGRGHNVDQLAPQARCAHNQERQGHQHLQRDHCVYSVHLSGGVVGHGPLLQKAQGQGQGGGDPAGDHGVAQQSGQIVANGVEHAKGQAHQERAVLGQAQRRDGGRVVEAEGGHGGGGARAQAGHAKEHRRRHLGPGPLVVDQGDAEIERAQLDVRLHTAQLTLLQGEFPAVEAFRCLQLGLCVDGGFFSHTFLLLSSCEIRSRRTAAASGTERAYTAL